MPVPAFMDSKGSSQALRAVESASNRRAAFVLIKKRTQGWGSGGRRGKEGMGGEGGGGGGWTFASDRQEGRE